MPYPADMKCAGTPVGWKIVSRKRAEVVAVSGGGSGLPLALTDLRLRRRDPKGLVSGRALADRKAQFFSLA